MKTPMTWTPYDMRYTVTLLFFMEMMLTRDVSSKEDAGCRLCVNFFSLHVSDGLSDASVCRRLDSPSSIARRYSINAIITCLLAVAVIIDLLPYCYEMTTDMHSERNCKSELAVSNWIMPTTQLSLCYDVIAGCTTSFGRLQHKPLLTRVIAMMYMCVV